MTQEEQLAGMIAENNWLRAELDAARRAGLDTSERFSLLIQKNEAMQRNIVESSQNYNSMREERDRLKQLLDMEYEHRETLRKLAELESTAIIS